MTLEEVHAQMDAWMGGMTTDLLYLYGMDDALTNRKPRPTLEPGELYDAYMMGYADGLGDLDDVR